MFFILLRYLVVQLLGCTVKLYLTFKEIAKLFFKVAIFS